MKHIFFIALLLLGFNSFAQSFPTIFDDGTEIWLNDSEYGKFLHTKISVVDGDVFEEGKNFYGIGMELYASQPIDSLDIPNANSYEFRFLAIEILGGTQITFEDNLACMWEYQYGELPLGKYIVFKFKLYDANENRTGFVLTTQPIKIKQH